MRVRCTATPDYRSNAVGDLELECGAEGLCIALRGVSSYREGYAPGPPVHANAVCVPWPGVYATRLGEDQLQLSIDARSFSTGADAKARYLPLNRFMLGDFAECREGRASSLIGPRELPYALVGASLAALGICLALARALPHTGAAGTLGWAVLVVALVLGTLAWRAHSRPGPPTRVVLDELCLELSRHVPNHVSAATPTPTPRSFEPLALSTLLPRSAVGIAITLAAATLAALVGSSAMRPRSVSTEVTALGAETAATAAPNARTPALADECACSRHESLPWQAPLSRLTPVIVSERRRTHDAHLHTELELALVNDGAREARQLNVSVVFFEAGGPERAGHWQTGERQSFFEGPLAPGQAIYWHAEGRGTSFDVIAPDRDTLAADGSDAAPADAFARLASDGSRAVRLHATQLLAFLGDARAASAASALSPSASPAEADYLDRLIQPARSLGVCALNVVQEATRWRVEACSFNRSARPVSALELRLLAFDAPLDRLRPGGRAPLLVAEQVLRSPAGLPARSARRVELAASVPAEPGRVARAFELEITDSPEVP